MCICAYCLVYAVIALFVVASSLALHECLKTLFHLLPVSDRYKLVLLILSSLNRFLVFLGVNRITY